MNESIAHAQRSKNASFTTIILYASFSWASVGRRPAKHLLLRLATDSCLMKRIRKEISVLPPL